LKLVTYPEYEKKADAEKTCQGFLSEAEDNGEGCGGSSPPTQVYPSHENRCPLNQDRPSPGGLFLPFPQGKNGNMPANPHISRGK
jgi:hypothetical protein